MTTIFITLLLTLFTAVVSAEGLPTWLTKVDLVVSQQKLDSQYPQFTSINAALEAASQTPDKPLVIYIAPGEYHERLEITQAGITLVGSSQQLARISYGRYAGQPIPGTKDETWGTFRTATVMVNAAEVSLVNLSIINSFDYPANEKLKVNDLRKVRGEQAVALHIGDGADKIVIQQVNLEGFQDTLYVQGGRSYFIDSRIAGHVDFIFGNGNALFENTLIVSRARVKPQQFSGYVTAPSTLISQQYGLTFLRCQFIRERGVPDNSVPLGRPWHPTTTFADGRYANPFAIGKTVIMHSFMDKHIYVQGWTNMGGTAKDGSKKQFTPADARFAEYLNDGLGALVNEARPQLTEVQAQQHRVNQIFVDWQPSLLKVTL